MTLNSFNKNTSKILLASFIFSLLMIVILHAALTSITRHNLEHSANILAQELSDNVYINNYDTPNDQKLFLESLEFIKNYPSVKINIYNNNAQNIISNNHTEIILNHDYNVMDYIAKLLISESKNTLNDALLNGKPFSHIIWSASLSDELQQNLSLIKVISPITSKNGKIFGAIEIYYDVSYQWRMLNNTRLFGLLLLTISFFIFYMLLENNILVAQRIINQQAAELERLSLK